MTNGGEIERPDVPVLDDEGRAPTEGDLALAGALLVVAVLSGLYVEAARLDTVAPTSWWQWLLMVTPPILVAVRRLSPSLVVVVVAIAQSAIWITGLPDVLLPVIVILYTAANQGRDRPLRIAIGASVALTAVTAAGVRIVDDVTTYQIPLVALTCGTAIALGFGAASRRRTVAELATEVADAKARARHERAEALANERNHIARELHDSVGHTLSVIAVRAEAADRVGPDRPEVAADAVAAIAVAARGALTETRQVLAGLRVSEGAELAPAPDLAAIRRLVTDLRSAGVDASLDDDGWRERQPSAVTLAGAYRIVQESLTNAVRHVGPDTHIEVTLTTDSTAFHLTVANSPVTDTTAANSPAVGSPDVEGGRERRAEDQVVAGSGLAGMTARAEVLGGRFQAGHESDGRFVVRAAFPIGQP